MDDLFAAMAACQALHPDAAMDDGGDDDDDGFFMGGDDGDDDEGMTPMGREVMNRLDSLLVTDALAADGADDDDDEEGEDDEGEDGGEYADADEQ